MKKEYTNEFHFEIQAINNGFLLNKVSDGIIIPNTKGKVIATEYFNNHEDFKKIIFDNISFALPIMNKGSKGNIDTIKIIIKKS